MHFWKYHGCGNDFLLTEEEVLNPSLLAKRVCNRHTGFGADGLILVNRNPLSIKIYNADGSEADMCGNGLRCAARYFLDQQIVVISCFVVETNAGFYTVSANDNEIQIEMKVKGKPVAKREVFEHHVYEIYEVNSGVIHLVVFGQEDSRLAMHLQGKYPMANVDFVKLINKREVELITYERGCGKTFACATGAVATYTVLREIKLVNDVLNIHLPYGDLRLWEGSDFVYLQGDAVRIGECIIYD